MKPAIKSDALTVTPETLKQVFTTSRANVAIVQKRLGRPLTYAEKVMYGHLADAENETLEAGKSYINIHPDRVALQDATAQMAILQFMQANIPTSKCPTTVHCDHLIRAQSGAVEDLKTANSENAEVYRFLESASAKYGLGFWAPGAGIIHQVVLEQYAFPGLLMLGTDSHTPNAGGLGAFAVGVGGASAVDAMVGMPWEVLHPEFVGVKLTGRLQGWASPKDVILKLLSILTVKGGTNRVIEYFGEGCSSLSATGKGTICNMGAELGATTSVFPYDGRMDTYLEASGRGDLVKVLHENQDLLQSDEGAEAHYSTVIEINLSDLSPMVVGPHTPDLAAETKDMAGHMLNDQWPSEIKYALIGSCTNSSYEDMGRIADMADVLVQKGVKLAVPLLVTPGSEQIKQTITRDGQLERLEKLGAKVLANACGPCIGMWQRSDIQKGEVNSIVSSFNRNFRKRNDGNPETCSFLTSPEATLAYAVFGRLDCDPFTTPITDDRHNKFILNDYVPQHVDEVPQQGLVQTQEGYQTPPKNGEGTTIAFNPKSERIQELAPFEAWDGEDYAGLRLLFKAEGKCTTDHISPAGVWLKFRGHLPNISRNMLSGAVNAFRGHADGEMHIENGHCQHQETGDIATAHDIAKQYRDAGEGWVSVGEENYGEGSSREHAAMSPRLMGCKAVLVKSFARIHESNLKKQGVLPLTFVNKDDYTNIQAKDRIAIKGLTSLAPNKPLTIELTHADGTTTAFKANHTLNAEQIEWFKAGSALNALNG